MRFSFAESMCDPSHYAPLAVAAERAGWTSFVVPDSICYPEISESRYPYTPDGNREFLEGKPFLEPFTLIPALGAVTETLRFTTFVVKLPIRQPVLVAKQAASVAVLTGNRFGFGVGLSPWPEDFLVTGTDWKSRGRRMDEMIEIIRGLTARADAFEGSPDEVGPGNFFEFHGRHYDVESIQICPVPTQPIPILIGGHAEPALRRAARLGDGWLGTGHDPGAIPGLVRELTRLRREAGREAEPFDFVAAVTAPPSVELFQRLEEQGVTSVIQYPPAFSLGPASSLSQKRQAFEQFGDRIIARMG
jgi:probable F420-dependent oxidoreductase